MLYIEWAIPEKNRTGGVEDILFWKRPLEYLDLSLYPCYIHWNFQGQKRRPMEIPY